MRNSIYPLLVTVLFATTAIASDDHSGHADQSGHEGVQVEATINTISGSTINLSHGPIPEIGWPAMTMDLELLEGAEVGDVADGQDALIVLEKGEDGMYAIKSAQPAE